VRSLRTCVDRSAVEKVILLRAHASVGVEASNWALSVVLTHSLSLLDYTHRNDHILKLHYLTF